MLDIYRLFPLTSNNRKLMELNIRMKLITLLKGNDRFHVNRRCHSFNRFMIGF